jgi:hypothetical protein
MPAGPPDLLDVLVEGGLPGDPVDPRTGVEAVLRLAAGSLGLASRRDNFKYETVYRPD